MNQLIFSNSFNKQCHILSTDKLPDDNKEYLYIISKKKKGKIHYKNELLIEDAEDNVTLNNFYYLLQYIRSSDLNKIFVIGDNPLFNLVGYISSSLLSIKRLIMMPTTVFSQVFLKIDGEFFLNYEEEKNVLGNIGMPDIVYIYPELSFDEGKLKLVNLISIINVSISSDMKLFYYLMNNYEKGTLTIDNYRDMIWLAVKDYTRLISDDKYPVGVNFAKYLQNIYRLKVSNEVSMAFGTLFSIWLSYNYGIIDHDFCKELIFKIKKDWINTWFYRIDRTSFFDFFKKNKILEFNIPTFPGMRKISLDYNDFKRIYKNSGIRMESFM